MLMSNSSLSKDPAGAIIKTLSTVNLCFIYSFLVVNLADALLNKKAGFFKPDLEFKLALSLFLKHLLFLAYQPMLLFF
jgi:hypothetical protein